MKYKCDYWVQNGPRILKQDINRFWREKQRRPVQHLRQCYAWWPS